MSDLAKILAENQKELFNLIAPHTKQTLEHQNLENSDSEGGNIFIALSSTPIESKTAIQDDTPLVTRSMIPHSSASESF